MKNEDKAKFLEQMNGCSVVYRHVVDGHLLDVFWKMLSEYEIEHVCLAFEKHLRNSKFFPTPAEIIALLTDGKSKHYGADEAWIIALKSMDEDETVVMTDEIFQARNIAWESWITGDQIAARMAFRDAYNRIISTCTTPPKWREVVGNDKSRVFHAVNTAVAQGLLPPGTEQKYLPQDTDAGPIAGLLTGKVTELPKNPELKKRWGDLRQALADGQARLEEQKRAEMEERQRKRIEFEERKQAAIDKAEEIVKKLESA